jgi:hypothetical protein
MSKAEILEELPKLKPVELAEIQSRIEDLAVYGPDGWLDTDELTAADKALLNARLAAYEKNPDAGSSWEEVEARIRARLKP